MNLKLTMSSGKKIIFIHKNGTVLVYTCVVVVQVLLILRQIINPKVLKIGFRVDCVITFKVIGVYKGCCSIVFVCSHLENL